jgi:Recombinase
VGRCDAGLGENFCDKKLAVSAGAFGRAHDCLFLFYDLARKRLASPDGVWQRPLVFAGTPLALALWIIAMSGAAWAREDTNQRAEQLRPAFDEFAGLSARKIAATLNERKIATHTGGVWHAATVIRV